MSLLEPPLNNPNQWVTPRGDISFWLASPQVLIVRLNGHLETELYAAFAAAATKTIETHHVRVAFFDCEKMTSYDTRFRVEMTDWGKRVQPRLRSMEAYVRSKIVAMGATVVSMAMGGFVKVTSSRSSFEHNLERALAAKD